MIRRAKSRLTTLPSAGYRRLKNCTAFSCFFAAALVVNVPRFRRFPVLGFFLRENNRYLPDFSFLIIRSKITHLLVRQQTA